MDYLQSCGRHFGCYQSDNSEIINVQLLSKKDKKIIVHLSYTGAKQGYSGYFIVNSLEIIPNKFLISSANLVRLTSTFFHGQIKNQSVSIGDNFDPMELLTLILLFPILQPQLV